MQFADRESGLQLNACGSVCQIKNNANDRKFDKNLLEECYLGSMRYFDLVDDMDNFLVFWPRLSIMFISSIMSILFIKMVLLCM